MKFKFKAFYLWSVVPVMIFILWVFAFYMPIHAQTKQKAKELSSLKQEEQKIELNLKNAMDVRKQKEKVKESIIEMQMQLPTIDAFPDFMIWLLKNIKKEGVNLSGFSTNFSSLESKPGSLLIHPVFELSLKGKYINIGKFIDDLDDRKVYKGITKARITYEEKEYPVLNGKFTLEFTARRSGSLEEGK